MSGTTQGRPSGSIHGSGGIVPPAGRSRPMPIGVLVDGYENKRQSLRTLAAASGVSVQAVRERLLRAGVPMRARGGPNALGKSWTWGAR